MRHRLLLLLLLVSATSASGQCIRISSATTDTGTTQSRIDFFLGMARRMVSDTSEIGDSTRVFFRLPRLSPDDVVLITDSSTIRKAASAFNRAELEHFGTKTAITLVGAVRVGSQGYLIANATYSAAEWMSWMYFDKNFVYISPRTTDVGSH